MNAVVEAVGAPLPELVTLRDEPKAAPVVGEWHLVARESRPRLLDLLLELRTVGERALCGEAQAASRLSTERVAKYAAAASREEGSTEPSIRT